MSHKVLRWLYTGLWLLSYINIYILNLMWCVWMILKITLSTLWIRVCTVRTLTYTLITFVPCNCKAVKANTNSIFTALNLHLSLLVCVVWCTSSFFINYFMLRFVSQSYFYLNFFLYLIQFNTCFRFYLSTTLILVLRYLSSK